MYICVSSNNAMLFDVHFSVIHINNTVGIMLKLIPTLN